MVSTWPCPVCNKTCGCKRCTIKRASDSAHEIEQRRKIEGPGRALPLVKQQPARASGPAPDYSRRVEMEQQRATQLLSICYPSTASDAAQGGQSVAGFAMGTAGINMGGAQAPAVGQVRPLNLPRMGASAAGAATRGVQTVSWPAKAPPISRRLKPAIACEREKG